jgi:F420-0:gamma-glutamyl ligase
MSIHIIGLTGLPEVQTGDDIARLIRAATPVVDRETIVVIAQKIVS